MSKYIWGDQETQFFFNLTPELVLDTVSKHGLDVTGRCLTLNSMENRVYEVEIDNEDSNVIVKFYRPGRWSKEQILEEHQFLLELLSSELPVIAPKVINGDTLFLAEEVGLYYCFFPKKGGRAPDEMNREQLEIVGRTLARIHNIGEQLYNEQKKSSRIEINVENFAEANLRFLLSKNIIPTHLNDSYEGLVNQVIQISRPKFQDIKKLKIHGDCHLGNIISRAEEGLFFIDFDDMLVGPAVQDIWLVTPGRDEEAQNNRNILLDAYETMRDFNYQELKLVEPLRTLRFIHFSAWIAKRWDDPAFKQAFPQFNEPAYWEIQINDLRTQIALIEDLDYSGQSDLYN